MELIDVVDRCSPRLAGSQIRMQCPFREKHTDGSGQVSMFLTPDINAYHCFEGSTRVPTTLGTFPISQLAGKTHEILTSTGEFVKAPFYSYGVKEIYSLTLSRESREKTILTTDKHRWFVKDKSSVVETVDLVSGSYLEHVIPNIRKRWFFNKEGIRHGIMFGDGTLSTDKRTNRYGSVNLHGDKKELNKYFKKAHNKGIKFRPNGESYIRISGGIALNSFKEFPSLQCSEEYLLGFLAGYIATDGNVTPKGIVSISSADKGSLEKLREICFKLGIATNSIGYQERLGYGKVKSRMYKFTFVSETLAPNLFISSSQNYNFTNYAKKYSRLRWRVVSVKPTGAFKEVYCAEVPETQSFALEDNILTGNCFSCKSKGKLTQLLVREFDVSLTEAYDYINMDAYLVGSRTVIKEAIREDPYYKLQTPKMYGKRKLSEEVLRKFKLGYNAEDVVIPFIENGKIVGYLKRNIENPTRYNLDFKRGKYVYNYKPKNSSAIVVEGAADVWRLVGWGLHAEGLGGTEFSLEIVEKLKAHKELYFALDNDLAGIRCADKLYQALYRDVEIHFIEYDGEDPEKSTRSSFFAGYKDPKDYYEFKSTFIDILEDE